MSRNPTFKHYGTARKSGRYPWGSGNNDLITKINKLGSGPNAFTEKEIADALGMSTTELREQKSLAKMAINEQKRQHVQRLRDTDMSPTAISAETGIPAATVRDLLRPTANAKYRIILKVVSVLKAAIDKHTFIDVGDGVEMFLGVTGTKMKLAIAMLKNEGYMIHYLREDQLGTGRKTSFKVMGPPGSKFEELVAMKSKVAIPNVHTDDGGETFTDNRQFKNIDPSRILVRSVEDGGGDKDGLIEIRRGVPDLDLGPKRYAQVRIAVDGSHYIKGVAVMSDDVPPGKDLVFYSSKEKKATVLDALKKQEVGENPFGSTTRAKTYVDGDEQKTSALNIVYEEGDWATWSKNLSSQMLSKQSPILARDQLALAFDARQAEYDEIMALTNPVVKKHLLQGLANDADAATVHLKAASMPRQSTNVLLPEPSMKPSEVYAPNYNNGDVVVLIRHPHGGIFEIPTLTVNNKNPQAKRTIGNGVDAVAIHPSVAQRLSGADYDGDNVILVPNAHSKIRTAPALEALKNFDPRATYKEVPGMKVMTEQAKELHMGNISNLITDMTIKGAPLDEIARAVRHSMVVIDSAKHTLNWEQSKIDNGIIALKRRYQGGGTHGASTVISRAGSQKYVPHRKEHFNIDPVSGKKVYTYTEDTYIDKSGNTIQKRTRSKKMLEISDAHDPNMSSGTIIEGVYADHANSLKALGNRARLSMINTPNIKTTPAARKTYAVEIASLNDKLHAAEKHRPLERKAQLLGGQILRDKKANNPGMSKKEYQTEKGRALILARTRLGHTKPVIDITPREWEAIQMGGVSSTKLSSILRNADMDQVKSYATPKQHSSMPPAKANRALVLLEHGYTNAEVASAIGVSANQIIKFKAEQEGGL